MCKKFRGLLISDFNIDILSGYLNNDENVPQVESYSVQFGQIIPALLNENDPRWKEQKDFVVVWTQPENVLESFQMILNHENVDINQILSEVDQFTDALLSITQKTSAILVPHWVYPTYNRGNGLSDMKSGLGYVLLKINLRLSENLIKARNIYILNTQRWIDTSKRYAFNPKLWYMGKIPFESEIFKIAAREIKLFLLSVQGVYRKLVIIDLDDTLWGGVVGDQGWEDLQLGGHDPIGEAFADFQKALKALKNKGILLGIVSKNEEAVAMEAIKNHPEMVLNVDDFSGWKINWKDKVENIVDLVAELNLGLQSTVFIDNSPIERARVKETLREVFVPDWPDNAMLFKKALISMCCFDTPYLSQEDLNRTEMYRVEKQRQYEKVNMGSLEEWLNSLKIKVLVEQMNEKNRQRIVQLLNKTNQMNLMTRRMSEEELVNWLKEDNRRLWTFRVSDKYGDYGLAGIVSLEINKTKVDIIDFVLSCRVFGRKIEETMVYTIIQYAKSLQLSEVRACYRPTAKNKPCLDFWKRSGFKNDNKENTFCWKLDQFFPEPKEVEKGGDLYGEIGYHV